MKKYQQFFLQIFLISVVLFMIHPESFANHVRGCDLQYSWVSGNTYNVTLTVYGDCSVTIPSLVTSQPVICTYDGGIFSQSDTLVIQSPSTGTRVSQVCNADSLLTTCDVPASTIPGTKKYVYSKNITLSGTSHHWRFIFSGNMISSSAGRAASITNITPSGTTIIQLVDTLDNTTYHNSSPNLGAIATPYFCVNNPDNYNPAAIDPDGDSLRFSLVAGINNSTATCAGTSTAGAVTYTGGASATAPIQSTSSFVFDPTNGQVAFSTGVSQKPLIVYNIEEYRNDTLIGTSQREMSFIVQTCTEPPPKAVISGAVNGVIVDTTHFQVCQNTGAFSFSLNPTEADTTYSIYVSASGIPTGATFTVTADSTNHPTCVFSWTSATTPGVYTFFVTFKDNACAIAGVNTVAYTVTVSAPATITGSLNVCAGSTTTLIDASPGGMWTLSNSHATIGSSSGIVTGVSGGADTVTFSFTPAHCTTTAVVTVNALPTVSSTGSGAVCAGQTATLNGTGAVSYSWTGGITNGVAFSPSPGVHNYTVTGTDANSCSNTAVATLTVNALPAVGSTGGGAICAGQTATLNGTGAVSYSWTGGITNGVAFTPSAGVNTYTVTGTDAHSCSNTAIATVTVNTLPTISAGTSTVICAGSSTILTASGGSTYTWAPVSTLSAGTGASVTASPTSTTTYTLTGTNGTCANTATVTVTVNTVPAIGVSPNVGVCPGSSATLTATGGTTYSWSPGTGLSATSGATVTASPSSTTTYTVTGTTSGCSNTATVTVSVNIIPTIGVSPGVAVCTGSSTTLTATGGTTYSWSPGTGLSATSGAAVTATPSSTTTYTVTGTTLGCSNAATVTVSVNAIPTLGISPNVNICIGSSTTLTATGGTTYSWAPGTGLSATTGASVTATPSSTTNYTVTGTNSGCSNRATVTVSVSAAIPTISAGTGVSICSGSLATLTATGGTTYTWTPPAGLSATTGASVIASPTVTTTYTVTGTTSICSNRATVTVTVATPAVYAVTGGGAYCSGGAGVYVGLNNSQTGVSYQLYKSGVASGSPVAGTGAAISFGFLTAAGVYTVVANPGLPCPATMSGSATVTVTTGVLPAPMPVGGGGTYCAGGSGLPITLPGSAVGVSYQLYVGGVAVGSPFAGIGMAFSFGLQTAPGTYTVIGTIAGGCSGYMIGSTNISVYPLPIVYTMTGGGNYCPGRTGVAIGLSGSAAGISYQLYRGGVAVSGAAMPGTGAPISFPAQTIAGTYTAVATNTTTFCVSNMAGLATVTASALAVYTVTGGGSVCPGSSGAAIGLGNSAIGVSYQLYRGATAIGSPVAGSGAAITFGYQSVAGTYTVLATEVSTGCTANMSGSAVITVLPTLPTFTVSGGGSYCSGGSGVAVTQSGSAMGTNYQLYRAATAVGAAVAGTSTSLSFGLQTIAGTYTVVATSTATGCTATMPGSAVVSVNPTPVISATTYTLTPTASITLTGSPAGGTWTSSNIAIATVGATTGVVHGVASGAANITYTLATGCKVSQSVTVTASVSKPLPGSTTGITTISGSSQVRVLPNPNKGQFLIAGTFSSAADQDALIIVTDLLGQVVYERKVSVANGEINETVQLGAKAANGVYLLNLRSASENQVARIVIER